MCPGTPTLQLGSTLYRGIYPLPSTIKLWYPVVSLVHSLACFHVSWFPHTAVRVYLLPWDLPSTLYRLPWDLPSTLYYQLTVSSGELSTLSNLFFMCPGSPTLQLGSTLYRGIYPLPSTVGSTLYPLPWDLPSTLYPLPWDLPSTLYPLPWPRPSTSHLVVSALLHNFGNVN